MKTRNSFLDNFAQLGSDNGTFDFSTLFPMKLEIYTPRFHGIVINLTGIIQNDGNLHVFFDHVPNVASYDILYAPDETYGFNAIYITKAPPPAGVQKKEWNSRLQERLYEYIINNGFLDYQGEYSTYRPECSFNLFAKVPKPSTINAYMRTIIIAVKEYWGKSHPNRRFPDRYDEEMLNYAKEFQIAFVSNTVNPNPRSNYQLPEYIGDQGGWSAMNSIFIKFLEQKPSPVDEDGKVIELNQNNITSMHRDLFSKNVQSKLARKLGVKQFIQTTGEIINKTYGDIYEAMVGVFLLVDYYISTRVRFETTPHSDGQPFSFHMAFLEWSYESVNLAEFEKKPYYTTFSENTTAIFGNSYFDHKNSGGTKITTIRSADRTKLLFDAKTFTFITTGVTKDMSKEIGQIISRATRGVEEGEAGADFTDNEQAKFTEINKMIFKLFTKDEITARKTRNNMAGWTDEQKEEFLELMEEYGYDYILNKHPINKLKTLFYWVVETVTDKKLLYTTENYTDSSEPEMLLSIIRKRQMDTVEIEAPVFREMTSSDRNRTYISVEEDGERNEYRHSTTEGGTGSISLEQNMREDPTMILHMSVKASPSNIAPKHGTHNGHIDYTPHPVDVFREGFDVEKFFKRFSNTVRYKFDAGKIVPTTQYGTAGCYPTVDISKRAILSYIGDRLSNKAYLFVGLMKHEIMNEAHLTNIKNYFRSNVLKDHFTYLMHEQREGEHLADALTFDEYLGLAPAVFENQLYELFKNIKVDDSFIEAPVKKLEKIRYAVDKTTYEKRGPFSVMRATDADDKSYYTYAASNSIVLSCEIGHRNIMILRDLFAKYCMQYEFQFKNKTIIYSRINSQFRHMKSYDKLRQMMEIRNVEDWEVIETQKLDMRFTLKFKSENDSYTYVTEKDFDEIIRTVTNTRGF